MASPLATSKSESNGLKLAAKVDDHILTLDCSCVKPDPTQPREYFNPVTIQSLAASIRRAGQKQPIIVTKIVEKSGGIAGKHQYQIVDGERRFRAITTVLQGSTIEAVIREYRNKDEQYIDSVVSNLPREGHTPLELLHAFQRLRGMKKSDIEIAEICACSISWVSQILSLENLVPEVLKLLDPTLPDNERLKTTIAIHLAKVKKGSQLLMAKTIIKQQLKIGRARQFIRTHHDGPELTADHTPRKDFTVIQRRVKRMEEDADVVLSISSGRGLENIFRSRTKEEKRGILENALATQRKLDLIINALGDVRSGKK